MIDFAFIISTYIFIKLLEMTGDRKHRTHFRITCAIATIIVFVLLINMGFDLLLYMLDVFLSGGEYYY